MPPGVTRERGGWNFSLHSRHASRVELLIFGTDDYATRLISVPHDPLCHKTGRIWHCFVPYRSDASYYGYLIDGPAAAEHRFDPQKGPARSQCGGGVISAGILEGRRGGTWSE